MLLRLYFTYNLLVGRRNDAYDVEARVRPTQRGWGWASSMFRPGAQLIENT